MRTLIAALLLFTSLHSHAGNRVGNGGHVFFCPKSGKIQTLDFYSAYGFEGPKATNEKDEVKIAEARLEKLKPLAPKLATQYLSRLATIKGEFDMRKGERLVKVEDSLHAVEPGDKDCEVYQLIIRKETLEKDEKRFVVNEDLWKKLSPTQKAGMLTHEIIYEHFYLLGETDSARARRLNVHIFSPKIETQTQGQFWQMIKDYRIPLYP